MELMFPIRLLNVSSPPPTHNTYTHTHTYTVLLVDHKSTYVSKVEDEAC